MAGETIEFPSNGGTATGYLATPQPDSTTGPGVVVIQEWWGLNDQIRATADRLASAGFTALAPDFYHGQGASIGEPDEAGKLMMALNVDQAARDARGAAQLLAGHPRTGGAPVGVLGFCMGGQLALLAGTVAPDEVGAVVDMYGIHPKVQPDFTRMRAAVLALFSQLDTSIPAEARQRLADQLRAAGVAFEMDVLPGVDHAFMNEQRPEVYNPAVAEATWQRIVAFLRRHLAPSAVITMP